MSSLQRAIDHIGSQKALAAALGVDPSNVSLWVRGKKPVPPRHWFAIETLTDQAVTARDLYQEQVARQL